MRDNKKSSFPKSLIQFHTIWGSMLVYFFFNLKVFEVMEHLPIFLGCIENSIISFSRNAREVVLFWGVEGIFLRFVKTDVFRN